MTSQTGCLNGVTNQPQQRHALPSPAPIAESMTIESWRNNVVSRVDGTSEGNYFAFRVGQKSQVEKKQAKKENMVEHNDELRVSPLKTNHLWQRWSFLSAHEESQRIRTLLSWCRKKTSNIPQWITRKEIIIYDVPFERTIKHPGASFSPKTLKRSSTLSHWRPETNTTLCLSFVAKPPLLLEVQWP